jgi:hypothetical protein
MNVGVHIKNPSAADKHIELQSGCESALDLAKTASFDQGRVRQIFDLD